MVFLRMVNANGKVSRMSKAENLKEVLEIIKESSNEAEQYKDESEFERGTAFAYRLVLNLFKEFGLDRE